MSKIHLSISNIDGNSKSYINIVTNAVKNAEDYAFLKLKIDWDIDVLARFIPKSNSGNSDAVNGHTYEKNLIVLNIEEDFKEYEISEVLVHELCHAARWGKNNEWINTLFDLLIFEGLAVKFAADFIENKKECQFYMDTILKRSDSDNEKIYNSIKDKLNDNSYNYEEIFVGDGIKMPYWSGYSLGYYLINKYLKKTGKKIEEAFADKYSEIESTLLRKDLSLL